MITHDSWPRIKEIFFSALDHTSAERSAFLTEVCGDDTTLLKQLEALLTADAENDDFLSETACEFAAGMFADEPREFSPGQEVGQYRIECFISSGGMGQIYVAHDTKLGRKVALKFISPEYAKDPHRVQRFEQEARAASALNHPNVCVIHDIGVMENGRHFIAMEFIAGPTLRDELAQRTIKPLNALDIIIQVGGALASAHAKGIVHRDIKPENIMLRPDGYVKVVDFGLAKLTELLPDQRHDGEAETRVHTEPHMIMGTVRYMSPEQLREAPVDERTDIWSLGVVLYEMLTGATLFKARSPNDSIALILAPQPCELQFTDDIPIPLRDIVKKALEKDCTQRYQTVTKLTSDLSKLKWQWEHNWVGVPSGSVFPLKDNEDKNDSVIFTRLKTQALFTADFLFSEIRTHKSTTIFAGATCVLILLLLFFLPRWSSPTQPSLPMRQLTESGTSIFAVATSDGKWVAHAEQQNGGQQLIGISADATSRFVAVGPENVSYLGISFSPDSQYLYFTRTEDSGDGKISDGFLYQLAWPSGKPIKLKEGVDSRISISPQGDRFAFVRFDEETTEYSLLLSNIDGTNEQVLTRRKNGDTLSLHGLAWSPDGSMVVCPAGEWKNGWHENLTAFDVKNGRERRIGDQSWFSIQQVTWQQDMKALVISATPRQTSPRHLWRISFPNGAAQEVTTDLSEYTSVSLAGDTIITVRTDRWWRIWIVPLDDLPKATFITTGVGLNHGINWTSTGKILFSSRSQDRLNIFGIDPDGSNRVQLTADAEDNYSPASSPDGRYIVFVSNRTGPSNIWRVNADGSDPKQLSKGEGNYYPTCSPDSKWVAYESLDKLTAIVWKVPIAGGEPVKVTEKYRMPVFSPNSEFITCRYDCVSGTHDMAIFSAQGGEPLRRFTVPVQEWQNVQYISDHEVSYVKNKDGYSNLWIYDLETGTAKQVTDFKADQIYAYSWSPDYKQVAFLRGTKMNNVTIISNSER